MDFVSSADDRACHKNPQAEQAAEKASYFVIPRRAARRGISLSPHLDQREIPRFVRNDKINYFFRKP
jgi:hypothetical protein